MEEIQELFSPGIGIAMELKGYLICVVLLLQIAFLSAKKLLVLYVKVKTVATLSTIIILIAYNTDNSIGHCSFNDTLTSFCTKCSGPYLPCHVYDVCYCSPDCFSKGNCCPDVENYLDCLEKGNRPYHCQNVHILFLSRC